MDSFWITAAVLAFAGGVIGLSLLADAVKALRQVAEIMAMCHAVEIAAFKAGQADKARAPHGQWDGADAPPDQGRRGDYFGPG
jgi:hypothetical protein